MDIWYSPEEKEVTNMESSIVMQLEVSVWTHGFQDESWLAKYRYKYVHVSPCFGYWAGLGEAKA